MFRFLLLLIVAALALPVVARAQTTRAGATASLDSTQLFDLAHRLTGKNRIRLVTGGERLEVRDFTLTPQALAFERGPDGSGPGAVAWSRIDQIQIRKSLALQGGLVGAGVLGLTGLGLGLSAECSGGPWSICLSGGDVALLTAAGAASGFLIGALVAAPFGRWSTIYRPDTVEPRVRLTLVPQPGRGGFAARLRFDIPGGP